MIKQQQEMTAKKKAQAAKEKKKKQEKELQDTYGIAPSIFKNETNLTEFCNKIKNIKEQHGIPFVKIMIKKSLENYNRFYNITNANILMVYKSSAGIDGWFRCDLNIFEEETKDDDDEVEAMSFDVKLNQYVDFDTGYYKVSNHPYIYDSRGEVIGEMCDDYFCKYT